MPQLLDDPAVRDYDPTARLYPPLPEFYEVIDGHVQEVPPMSDYAGEVADRLVLRVQAYLLTNPIGTCSTERLFRIPQPNDPGRNRRPDVSFVSFARWPADRPYPPTAKARDAVPDIAVEVVSPNDFAEDLVEKVREYLGGGVRLVWVVYPLAREIHAYWPGANTVRVYAAADDLDAGDVLPGFRTALAPLFPPVAPDPAA